MIQIFPKEAGHSARNEWLESHFSFSFGPYYDPKNVQFGPLRVLNDDIIQPGNGFGVHPHREAEVVSIALSGQLKHEDSLGNSGVIEFGQVQRMTAGTGILHSEVNPSETKPGRFLQLWFFPDAKQLPPSYEDISYDTSLLKNQLVPIVAPNSSKGIAKIHQDATVYLSKIDAKEGLEYKQKEGRKIFVYIIDGKVLLNNEYAIEKHGSARIADIDFLKIDALEDSFIMLIDLPGGEQ
ncbi:pirin family protein [Niallia nealsonii]|uniref:Pirin family protein n=1 Tax=Niallia nealsonii TaxID=115979 RepID=A0A2N0YX40_9BACI|nr:pirin-like bicupin family protein [Niallia nealsonii]PKG21826.1 pirin family protein [Niallia nealsonii]